MDRLSFVLLQLRNRSGRGRETLKPTEKKRQWGRGQETHSQGNDSKPALWKEGRAVGSKFDYNGHQPMKDPTNKSMTTSHRRPFCTRRIRRTRRSKVAANQTEMNRLRPMAKFCYRLTRRHIRPSEIKFTFLLFSLAITLSCHWERHASREQN